MSLNQHLNTANPNQPHVEGMSDKMVRALADAEARWDSAVTVDRRTWRALYYRGLVDVRIGKGRDRRGNTAYNVVTGIYINDAGRQALKHYQND